MHYMPFINTIFIIILKASRNKALAKEIYVDRKLKGS